MRRSNSATSLMQKQQQAGRDRRFSICKTSVRVIYAALERRVDDWQSYINLARSVMSSMDELDFMSQADKTDEQIWIITGLQKLAYYRPDEVSLRDIADWAIRQWLTISEREPANVDALQGMGNNWLFRAQPSIAAIERLESSSSSTDPDDEPASSESVVTSDAAAPEGGDEDDDDEDDEEEEEEEHDVRRSSIQAQARLCTPHYVEARGILLPATEFYERAVDMANSQEEGPSGGLLALAAESFMSLGNVSFDEPARRYFSHALEYLKQAEQIPRYELPAHLKEWLDEYGRLTS